MNGKYLKPGILPFKNITAKPVRTTCLAAVAAVLAFTLLGGSLLILNLRQGLTVMANRFGADIMIVPKGTAEQTQSMLLRGETGYFYFDSGYVDTVARTEGVLCASPQFFLSSLSAECCDAAVQLIGYDPETDFVVQPWIAEKYGPVIGDGQVVVGNRIFSGPNGTIKLFNKDYPVAARLSSSASGLDTSIFMTMNTMRQLIAAAHAENYGFLADSYGENAISAVLAKLDRSKSDVSVVRDIRKQNEGVDVLIAQGIFSAISGTLEGLVKYIRIFSFALWALALIVLAAVFSGTIHERKKEFAILRILGATRKKLAGLVLSESALTAIAGGIAGAVLAGLAVFPFSALISERLELPYLNAPFVNIALTILGSLFLSVITGPLASLYAALRISKAETYFTLREGE